MTPEIKENLDYQEISESQKQIKELLKSSLPDKIKKQLVEGILDAEKEAGIKKKEILQGLSNDIRKELSEKLGIKTDYVDGQLVNGLKKLPSYKDKIKNNITQDIIKNKENFIKQQPTVFIDVKGSYTAVDKNTYVEDKGWVGSVYDYLGNTDYTIENAPVYEDFQSEVDAIKDLIKNSSSYKDFLQNIRGYLTLDDLLLQKDGFYPSGNIQARKLQVLSYIANINLYNSKMFSESSDEMLKAANWALQTNYSPDEYFSILKQSLVNNKHIDATTCIQVHTFIAKIWEDLGYGEGITSTVDIGVSHRLAILKDKETGKLYLISDGLMLEGNSYKELVSLLPGRFVLLHYLYNSDNKQIGTVQTDTEKQVVKNLDGYGVNSVDNGDTQAFMGNILDKNNLDYLHRKNQLKMEIGNQDKYLFAQRTFDDGTFTNLKVTDNYIPTQGNTVKSVSVGFGGGNSNFDIRINLGTQWIDKKILNDREKEQIYHFYTGILAATDKHYLSNGLYARLTGHANWSMTFEDNGVPITNAQGHIGAGLKVGKEFGDNEIYVKGVKSYRIESATSLNQNTQIFKPTVVDGGYTIGIGGESAWDKFRVGGEIDYHKEKGKQTVNGKVKIQEGDLAVRLKYGSTKYETTILPDEKYIAGQVDKKINDNRIVYGGVEHKEQGDLIKSDKAYLGVKLQF